MSWYEHTQMFGASQKKPTGNSKNIAAHTLVTGKNMHVTGTSISDGHHYARHW
jgi:hypothetical protein